MESHPIHTGPLLTRVTTSSARVWVQASPAADPYTHTLFLLCTVYEDDHVLDTQLFAIHTRFDNSLVLVIGNETAAQKQGYYIGTADHPHLSSLCSLRPDTSYTVACCVLCAPKQHVWIESAVELARAHLYKENPLVKYAYMKTNAVSQTLTLFVLGDMSPTPQDHLNEECGTLESCLDDTDGVIIVGQKVPDHTLYGYGITELHDAYRSWLCMPNWDAIACKHPIYMVPTDAEVDRTTLGTQERWWAYETFQKWAEQPPTDWCLFLSTWKSQEALHFLQHQETLQRKCIFLADYSASLYDMEEENRNEILTTCLDSQAKTVVLVSQSTRGTGYAQRWRIGDTSVITLTVPPFYTPYVAQRDTPLAPVSKFKLDNHTECITTTLAMAPHTNGSMKLAITRVAVQCVWYFNGSIVAQCSFPL